MELIPGLPEDLARECLVRVPYDKFPTASSTCKGWKLEISSPEFVSHRKSAGISQTIVVLAQAQPNTTREFCSPKYPLSPVYNLSVYEPRSGQWANLPPIPVFSTGIPMFCQLAAVGSELVILGGLDPVMWDVLDSVYVYNFSSATWRRGADMPGAGRSFFACASDGDRVVYVAGGHDSEKNSLKSALAYDVARDQWIPMPDMVRERDECKGIYRLGKFHVIGGYPSDMQGKFERSSEAFDPTTWNWGAIEEDVLAASMFPGTCVGGDSTTDDGSLYMCRNGQVVVRRGSIWHPVAKLPSDVLTSPCHVTKWPGNLMVVGSGRSGKAYILDLAGTYRWTEVETPEMFFGQVMGGCCLEI